ncbi:oligosaccharide flippase family protein [Sphingomonas sp. TDK1]|uniref:oligosaccharide flippase family protein n=1 Tax=Sphingomonas sp. TDK1 TaxID=453247 RepID=UPI001E352782|nr:oligosaccharide flippase family protein [Sphingomonas sp. TDK1]
MVEAVPAPQKSLRAKAITSVIWSVARVGGDQIFNFIVFAVLARFLSPAQFGIFIVAMITAEVGKVIAQGGLVSSLYRVPVVTAQVADTIFWTNTAISILYAAAMASSARYVAIALGSAEAAPLIFALAFVVPVSAAGATHMARNLLEFGHKALAVRSLLGGLVGGALAIAAAWQGWGIWALVVQRLSVEIIGTLVAWYSFSWRPTFQFSFRVLREQYGLGLGVAGSQLLFIVLNRLQDVIIGRMIGLYQVGIYRTSWKTIEVIVQGAIIPVSTVSLPVLSKLRDDEAAVKRNYLKMLSAGSLLAFPAITGGGAVAGVLIPLLYGRQWEQSIPVAWVLAFMAPAFVLNSFGDAALTVKGHPKVILWRAIVQIVLTLLFCIPAAQYGIIWFAVAFVAHEYVAQIFQLTMFARATSIRVTEIVGAVRIPVIASIAMVAVLGALQWLVPIGQSASGGVQIVYLLALVGCGILSYAGLVFALMKKSERREAFSIRTYLPGDHLIKSDGG